MTTTGQEQLLDSAADVLGFVRSQRRLANVAEAAVLAGAVTWAEQHPPESIHLAATWTSGGAETGLPLAGEGAPLVAEFCLAEFAAALGVSTDSGRALVAEAVELKHRLPRTWARVQAHDLPAWRARRVAAATLGLTREAAEFVDAQVAPFAHKIGPAALDRLVAESVGRFMPAQALQDARRAADGRHVTIHHRQVSFTGTSSIEGELDLADALDLDAALSQRAESLQVAGCVESLDVRRSIAAGEIARRQLALNLQPNEQDEAACGAATGSTPKQTGRQVVLHVHLSDRAIRGTCADGCGCAELGRIENTRQPITVEQVRGWCANPGTTVVVRPVVDLEDHYATGAYAVPERLRAQTEERDQKCVFPWCTRSARACDCDHVIARDRGGTTCSCNIAPLCRRHHRLKTKTTWTYTVLEPGTYLWSSPHGYQFLRDPTGTLDVTRERPPSNASACQLRIDPPEH